MKRPFAGIDISDFLNDWREWHAMVEGFADGFCFGKHLPYEPDDDGLKDIQHEHHYYNSGRALGLASFIVLITGMIVWFIGAINGI